MLTSVMTYIQNRESIQKRLKMLLCEKLQLPIGPDEIDPDAALFGTGLDLDSIDAVEIVILIENEFSMKLRPVIQKKSMRSLNTLTDAIMLSEAADAH
ncbi:MAG: hypothetical protein JW795_03855 [Chitinivibrionales bacterium]|nr:hypothetical protein [Chitinivibrionales bacterium]